MIKEAIDRILNLAAPNVLTVGKVQVADKGMTTLVPPTRCVLQTSTLQSLVDLLENTFEAVDLTGVLFHVESPTMVSILPKLSDEYGRRIPFAKATYPGLKSAFVFGQWYDPEAFIIATQGFFQRVKIENEDGSFAKDLDYVLSIASSITAENAVSNVDDGFAQRVAVKSGVSLKQETVLKPFVNLAPYRTFAEIDQVLSPFVFRARIQGESAKLALFEADGGRWNLQAAELIKAWLYENLKTVPVIS